jgi:RimJ/RimL family protein N-acetyltransferase
VEDAGDLGAIWNDPNVRRFLFDDQPVSKQLVATVLEECLTHADKGYGLWVVCPVDASVVAGCAGLIPTTVAAQFESRLKGLLEPLVSLHPTYWHRGYATEALTSLVDYAFTKLQVRELAAVNDIPNAASSRLLQRLGFSVLSQVAGPKYQMQTYHLVRP